MTLFIPEWQRSSGSQLQCKRVLKKLDGDYVVRKCIAQDTWSPDFFLQRGELEWLALMICELPFDTLDPGQLFVTAEQTVFSQMLEKLSAFEARANIPALRKLVVMWGCDSDQSKALWTRHCEGRGIWLMSKKTFIESGAEQLPKLLKALSQNDRQAIMGYYFPEAEVAGIRTTRRQFVRDNSARTSRYFLDTQQEWASKLDLELPDEQTELAGDFSVRLINGVAGSGKTLIAANRAFILARKYPDQHVLMLIHNVPVVKDLKHRLQRVHGEIPANLTIITALGWISKQWRTLFKTNPKMPDYNKEVTGLIQYFRALEHPDLKPDNALLLDEFNFINDTVVADEADYLKVERAGQGFALRKEERQQVWALYERVTAALLKQSGLRLWSALPRDLCLANRPDKLAPYQHILVDEAQFFAPSWFQLIKLTLEKTEGTLFLCADPNQGFLKSRLSWKRVGLDVAGKTKKLRKSYRTTQAILSAANQMLAGITQTDPDDYLQPDFEGMDAGTPPLFVLSPSSQDAVAQASNEIADHQQRFELALSGMLLLYGKGADKTLLIKTLKARFGTDRIWDMNDKNSMPTHDESLRIATVESATGLEANVVFLVGLEKLLGRTVQSGSITEDEIEQNARKLYMAMTRAGQRLVLISSTPLPEKIAGLFKHA
ncbi:MULTISPECIES: 3'-5' exonuclease [Pseudomonas syringae group]|nr:MULTISPECIES: 3'-5' exonuclease [Pseudomonas syringae group]EGH02051.1 putative ATP-binding protein [Pseudomonas amygdali pv. aesculi str. 0893_23]KPX21706.1 putative ATP-binding protein [Pseudomonas amygdali pv. dendropanacis]KWS79626.1 ATP-binding protein [Pseudomonas amygdali pv. dendropanacis]KWS98010.1 ATP-binding protein [Pseudomonas syringae pv. cerasicola]KWT13044.1 ATP-binding protein [Pseudomonas amygdali pv. aesculi]